MTTLKERLAAHKRRRIHHKYFLLAAACFMLAALAVYALGLPLSRAWFTDLQQTDISITAGYAPYAEDPSLSLVDGGVLHVERTLKANFEYRDPEEDAEDDPTFEWFWYEPQDEGDPLLESIWGPITGESGQTYTLRDEDAGKQIAVIITPNAKTGFLIGNPTDPVFTNDKVLALYTITTNIVTVPDNPQGGSISVDTHDYSGRYIEGSNLTLTPSANLHYRLVEWYVGVEKIEGTSYSFQIHDDATISAKFIRVYDLTSIVDGEGAIIPSVVRDGQTIILSVPNADIDHGEDVAFEARADNGWRFDRFTHGTDTHTLPFTVKMGDNTTVTAHFIKLYTLTTESGAGGTIIPSPEGNPHTYDVGDQVTVRAVPGTHQNVDSQWRFSRFIVNGREELGVDESYSFNIAADTAVKAEFDEWFRLYTEAELGGSISHPGDWHRKGSQVTVTATANQGYTFHRFIVTQNGKSTEQRGASTYHHEMTGPCTIEAQFNPIPPTVKYSVTQLVRRPNGNQYDFTVLVWVDVDGILKPITTEISYSGVTSSDFIGNSPNAPSIDADGRAIVSGTIKNSTSFTVIIAGIGQVTISLNVSP